MVYMIHFTTPYIYASNTHLKQVAEFTKRGIWEAGGFPLEFPISALGESMKPTTMLYRYVHNR